MAQTGNNTPLPNQQYTIFHDHEDSKRLGKLKYRGSSIQTFKKYMPEVAEERAKYWTVMAELYNVTYRQTLLFLAHLQITLKNRMKKRFSYPEKANFK